MKYPPKEKEEVMSIGQEAKKNALPLITNTLRGLRREPGKRVFVLAERLRSREELNAVAACVAYQTGKMIVVNGTWDSMIIGELFDKF